MESSNAFSVIRLTPQPFDEDGDNFSGTELICDICEDEASGRHYGAIACNGCKGFFRRTVRRGHNYKCRFSKQCTVNRTTRAACRFCRHQKCLRAGMRPEAVQVERDAIGKRDKERTSSGGSPPSVSNPDGSSDFVQGPSHDPSSPPSIGWPSVNQIIGILQSVEQQVDNLGKGLIPPNETAYVGTTNEPSLVRQIVFGIKTQLALSIEWASRLTPFNCLSASDKNVLMIAFSRQHVLFNIAFRSRDETDCLLLMNGQRLPKDHAGSTGMFARTTSRIIDQLVIPMKFMALDHTEYLLLKACVLFNPVARNISAEGADYIHQIRRQLCMALDNYVTENKSHEYGRTNDLLLFFNGPLQVLSSLLAEDIFITKLAGLAEIDKLIERLYLCTGDNDNIIGYVR